MRLFSVILSLLVVLAVPAFGCEGRLIEGPGVVKPPICVPTEPRRIVVLDPTFSLGMSLDLDLPVIGAPLFGMSDEALQKRAEERSVKSLGAFTEPSLEKLIALKPDLIIGSGLAGESVFDLTSQIAPTVLITQENWKDYFRKVAAVTGRADRAEAALEEYETRVAGMRTRVPDTVVSVVRITPWDFQVYLDGPDAYGPFGVLHDLGVRRTSYETFSGTGPTMKRPDWESLQALQGDILLYIVGGANNSDVSGRREEVLSNPLWQMLPAVRADRVKRVDAATWMEFNGLASAYRVLDDVERLLISNP